MKKPVIAIDGPTGAGKTTVSKCIAQKLGLTYVDTGAMYRAIGLFVLRRGIGSRDAGAIITCLPEIGLEISRDELGQQCVLLNGEDVTGKIRGELESKYASDVSAVPEVRAFLLEFQRGLAFKGGVIMEGRDIGTVVLPGADIKIFLTATSEIRAQRRHNELLQSGVSTTLEEVHAALLERDHNDSTRKSAPLRPAEGALMLDSTHMSFERVCAKIEAIIKEKASV